MNTNTIVANEINRKFTQAMYNDFYGVEINVDTLNERIEVLTNAMRKINSENDCWKVARACATMWANDDATVSILCQVILS